MAEDPKTNPSGTYVLDEDMIAEIDDVGLTGIVRSLADYVDESDLADEDENDAEG